MRVFYLCQSRDFLTTSARQFLGFFLGFAASICIAKALGPAGNGVYITFTTACGLSILISSFGTQNYTAYVSARKLAPDTTIISGIVAFPIILSVPIVICCVSVASSGAVSFEYLPLLCAAVFSGIIGQSCLSFLQGKGDLFGYNIALLISPTTLALFSISAFFLKSLNLILTGYTIGETLLTIFVISRILKKYPVRVNFHEISIIFNHTKASIIYGLKSQFIVLAIFFIYRSAILILAVRSTPKDVGTLGLALSILEKTWFFSQAASTVFFKRMASSNFSKVHLNELAAKVGAASFICICILIIVIKFSWAFLGSGYSCLFDYALILAPGIIAGSSAKIYVNRALLRPINFRTLRAFFFLVIVALSLNYVSITFYQSYGAAAAISAGYVLYFLTVYYVTE